MSTFATRWISMYSSRRQRENLSTVGAAIMDTVGSRPQPADQVMSWRSTLALPKELLLTPCQVIYGFLGSEYYASLCNTPTDFSAHGESHNRIRPFETQIGTLWSIYYALALPLQTGVTNVGSWLIAYPGCTSHCRESCAIDKHSWQANTRNVDNSFCDGSARVGF